jgi:hypothetical protein
VLSLIAPRLLKLVALLAAAVLASTGLALAQGQVLVRLQPLAGSSVSAIAVITSSGDAATVTLDAGGLKADTTYRALLQAGTCAQPSASAGNLGELKPDAGGKATLAATEALVSASGSPVTLSLAGLTDSDHALSIVGTTAAACGAIPKEAASVLPATGRGERLPMGLTLAATGLAMLLLGLGARRLSRRPG